jgi:hypothetical protein
VGLVEDVALELVLFVDDDVLFVEDIVLFTAEDVEFGEVVVLEVFVTIELVEFMVVGGIQVTVVVVVAPPQTMKEVLDVVFVMELDEFVTADDEEFVVRELLVAFVEEEVLFVPVAVEFGEDVVLEVFVTIVLLEVISGAQVIVVVVGGQLTDELVTIGELDELELVAETDDEFVGALDVAFVDDVMFAVLEVFERVSVVVVVLVDTAVAFSVKVVVFVSVGEQETSVLVFVTPLVVFVGTSDVLLEEDVLEVVVVELEWLEAASAATPTAIAAIIMITMTTIAIVAMACLSRFIFQSINLNRDSALFIYAKTMIVRGIKV